MSEMVTGEDFGIASIRSSGCNLQHLLFREWIALGSSVPTLLSYLPTYLPTSLLLIHIYSVPMVQCLHSTRRFGSSRDSSIVDIAFSVSEGSGRKWVRVSRDVRCVGDSSQPRQCALNESAVARCIHFRVSNQSRQ